MSTQEFVESLAADTPPPGLSSCVEALWWARKGDWEQAHRLAQEVETSVGSLVHAYLHRVEGDVGNAGYWYARAGRPAATGTLEAEWEELVKELL